MNVVSPIGNFTNESSLTPLQEPFSTKFKETNQESSEHRWHKHGGRRLQFYQSMSIRKSMELTLTTTNLHIKYLVPLDMQSMNVTTF